MSMHKAPLRKRKALGHVGINPKADRIEAARVRAERRQAMTLKGRGFDVGLMGALLALMARKGRK